MEATVSIEQFGRLLQLEEEDGALLRVVRQLQSILKGGDVQAFAPQPTAISWVGWT